VTLKTRVMELYLHKKKNKHFKIAYIKIESAEYSCFTVFFLLNKCNLGEHKNEIMKYH